VKSVFKSVHKHRRYLHFCERHVRSIRYAATRRVQLRAWPILCIGLRPVQLFLVFNKSSRSVAESDWRPQVGAWWQLRRCGYCDADGHTGILGSAASWRDEGHHHHHHHHHHIFFIKHWQNAAVNTKHIRYKIRSKRIKILMNVYSVSRQC